MADAAGREGRTPDRSMTPHPHVSVCVSVCVWGAGESSYDYSFAINPNALREYVSLGRNGARGCSFL